MTRLEIEIKLRQWGFVERSDGEFVNYYSHRTYRVAFGNDGFSFYTLYAHKDGAQTWELLSTNNLADIRLHMEGQIEL
jgi:hypothetical protein